ncbi:nucleoside hydrolase [Variovorax sp. PBL-E5]|uniref:nucleoside hydrolase n=1 Tax=Variovorax sp. PBL-E5 TaxID=434014 RepID=UPI0013176F1F|nr:nucleoside hydrolase [Variovorax sp. PBL-E5]VTU36532.1 Pyrimidine-specific ribonucleoside hydrolase RihA [Variovorax sp. PBL-E5]
MKRVWIDTDMGFDDLAAVLTVAQTPGWRIDGLSLVAGNAPLEVVIDNALRSAAYFGWDFPIHAGCARPLAGELVTAQNILGADAMGSAGRSLPPARAALTDVDAVGALGRYLAAAGEPVALLALGPLTNIATLLRQRPELAARITPLMWMGGSAGPGNHTAAAEFNAAVDPEAINAVLDAGVPLQMVGLDACRQVRVHAADADALRALGTDKAEVLADLLLGYVRIASSDGSLPMALYDPSAAAALVAPGCMRLRPAHVVAECQGEHTRGMTVVEWRVPRRAAANAQVASVADEALLRRVVLDALAQAARAA